MSNRVLRSVVPSSLYKSLFTHLGIDVASIYVSWQSFIAAIPGLVGQATSDLELTMRLKHYHDV